MPNNDPNDHDYEVVGGTVVPRIPMRKGTATSANPSTVTPSRGLLREPDPSAGELSQTAALNQALQHAWSVQEKLPSPFRLGTVHSYDTTTRATTVKPTLDADFLGAPYYGGIALGWLHAHGYKIVKET